jgi:hypothetical protein
MKLAIMQPYFFPYLGYFQLIAAVDRFILYENVNYMTKKWMNRNRILLIGKGDIYINAPIAKKSVNKKIYEIKIDNSDKNWRHRILRTIRYNYQKSVYFSEVYDLLTGLLLQETDSLHHFNCRSIAGIAGYIGVDTEILSENSRYLSLEEDLCRKYSTENTDFNSCDKKTERIIGICKNENAGTYINAINGMSLYDKDYFKSQSINLLFLKTFNISYRQFSQTFIPDLSIIDVLMHNGRAGTKQMLSQYELI